MKYQGAFSRSVGFAGKRFLFSPPPPPPPSILFCSRCNFRAITRLETLATQVSPSYICEVLCNVRLLITPVKVYKLKS